MTKVPTAIFVALTLALLSGCGGQSGEQAKATPPPTLDNPDAIAAYLPSGVTLETKVTDKDGDSEAVKDVLARYQAKPKNKKLYDINGREIQFYRSSAKGLMINQDKQYNKLRQRYTVIVYERS